MRVREKQQVQLASAAMSVWIVRARIQTRTIRWSELFRRCRLLIIFLLILQIFLLFFHSYSVFCYFFQYLPPLLHIISCCCCHTVCRDVLQFSLRLALHSSTVHHTRASEEVNAFIERKAIHVRAFLMSHLVYRTRAFRSRDVH